MTVGTLRIDGKKFRIISEEDYRALKAAARAQAREDASDIAIARKRLKTHPRKTTSLAQLKAGLGL